jgi:nitrate/TMAO reductase-like tetraheme cytochrome c subunit
MKRRLPPDFYNPITFLGMTIATIMLVMALLMILLDVVAGFHNAYSGLVTYIALPSLMFFGLFIALVGIVRTRRRHKRDGVPDKLPVIDLNVPKQRMTATGVALGGLVLMALSGFGSYKGYEYTESVQFCGTTCHTVMEPEYATYGSSPHARVACVGCHIGDGVDWYVKSKLSGSYQLYSTLFNKFDRPIKTPVANLRPAQETCEQCHWPKHFFTQKLRTHQYYLSDEENSQHNMSMLVKIGGGEGDAAQGIHAHMYLNGTVSYVATDYERQNIAYVEMRDPSGKVTVYRDPEAKLSEGDLAKSKKFMVDCIDCHNRPTHIFRNPAQSMDAALALGKIDISIPEIKSEAVELLDASYATKDEAIRKISTDMVAYYNENYPDFMKSDRPKLDRAISVVQGIYRQNYFPEMKTDWRSHRDNLDHMRNKGCFRCHNNKLVSDTGRKITNDCQSCHMIVSQGQPGKERTDYKGMEYQHPVDIGDEWKTTPCMECHGPDDPEGE